MRLLTLALLALIALVHAELWFGKGGLPHLWALKSQLRTQQAANDKASAANERLNAEVSDLKEGLEMVEEKARAELGMVRADEILVQISSDASAAASAALPMIASQPTPATPRRR